MNRLILLLGVCVSFSIVTFGQNHFESSAQLLSFPASGGQRTVLITTNASSYEVVILPAWCTITKYPKYIVVHCEPHKGTFARTDWIQLLSENKETITIKVNQTKNIVLTPPKSTIKHIDDTDSEYKPEKCFNCPKGCDHTFKFSVSYINKDLIYKNDLGSTSNFPGPLSGIQAGIMIEPLFKYGFGINTGVFYELYYANNTLNILNREYTADHFLSIPLQLAYAFNFSEGFSLFLYGGASVDIKIKTNPNEDLKTYNFYPYYDVGVGMRINHGRISVGKSIGLDMDNASFHKFRVNISACLYH
jgi:hypothetical protein